MTDVAREAGCSQATVSFVLNQSPGIKLAVETRQRVMEAARRLGYSAPLAATVKRESAVRRIGFLVDQLATSPEAAVAIDSASAAARAAGAILLVSQTANDPRTQVEAVQALVESGVAGLIYMSIFTREIELPAEIAQLDIPVLLLNCYTQSQSRPAVVPSELAGGQRCTRHLIEQGHRRIATITGEVWMEAAQDRLKGYRRALASADIPFDPDYVIEGDWSASAGYVGTRALLALPNPPTAIFCQNDRTAIGCYQALTEAGLSIPRDMSVLGYDDEEICRHLHPRLSSAILPHRAMGQWVIQQFTAGVPPAPRYPITRLECPLVERESIAPPR
ncbi:LacI family DNA-binding transcriptional regulator [Devosia sp. A449]